MIDKPILVRITTGDVFLGILFEETESGILLSNPVRVDIIDDEDSPTPYIGIFKWDDFSDEKEVYFDKFHVLYYTLPSKQLLGYYEKHLSHIDTATKITDTAKSPQELQDLISAVKERLLLANTDIN